MGEQELLAVEVAYALPGRQWLLALRVPVGTTAREAIARSGILGQCPDIDPEEVEVGIFGERCALDTVLREGDRVEIYRPLKADPKVVRRELARIGRAMGRRGPVGDDDD
jgi:putative ubiquitin-RnfH superfamily antitoxin RatB of RatAB toxin-antitoxin module